MRTKTFASGAALAVSLLFAGQALATANNDPPPAGPVILDLAGTPVPHVYTQYNVSFVADSTTTDLSFAFREDPAFLSLDDVSLTTGGGPNLVVNGGFELGPVGSNAPADWTYLNVFGSEAAGIDQDNNPHSGEGNYFDGSVQAYDAITQAITTVVGTTYNLSFWLDDSGGLTTFSALSTNGDTTDTGGNGIDLVVYAGNGIPTIAGGVPEPTTWALMLLGFGGMGAMLRRRRATASAATA
jgi:hypothetical protein